MTSLPSAERLQRQNILSTRELRVSTALWARKFHRKEKRSSVYRKNTGLVFWKPRQLGN
jgi:hypothetical protein